jgi:hypothetical protein
MSENQLAMFSVEEQEGGNLELKVKGTLSKIAALLATAMEDDDQVERAFMLALLAVQSKRAEGANKAQMN